MKLTVVVGLVVPLFLTASGNAQAGDANSFGRKNTYAAFFNYSNDSSHIVLGSTAGRKFTEVGFQYERRLKTGTHFVWKYTGEFRPLIAESDVTTAVTTTFLTPPPFTVVVGQPSATVSCRARTTNYSFIDPENGMLYSGSESYACGRRWTYMEGLSPLGTRINLRPHSRWQPTATILSGLLLSAKKIPIDTAGSFNFMFQIGAGVEYFRTGTQSFRLEYQLQHFSNAYTAASNPGVDSGLFKFTWAFGR